MISIAAAAAIIAGVSVEPVCVWNDPGAHAVTVNPVSSLVDHYTDIEPEVREKLKRRIDKFQYDEIAEITKDGNQSELWKYSPMQFMHFGDGRRVCGTVRTDHWASGFRERAMVYCEGSVCIMIPTVCRNVSRVTRIEPARRDRGAELIEELQPLALIDPIPVSVIEIPSLTYPPLEIKDIQPDYRVDPVFRRWPEPSFFDLWGRPLLPGETRTFERLPVVYPIPPVVTPIVWPVKEVKPADLPDGDAPGSVQPIPEPGTYVLMALGLVWVSWTVWSARRKV